MLVKSADKVVVLAVKGEFMYSAHVTRNNLVHREREALLLKMKLKKKGQIMHVQ